MCYAKPTKLSLSVDEIFNNPQSSFDFNSIMNIGSESNNYEVSRNQTFDDISDMELFSSISILPKQEDSSSWMNDLAVSSLSPVSTNSSLPYSQSSQVTAQDSIEKKRKSSYSQSSEELSDLTIKRLKNKEAAQRSRNKKINRLEELEQKVALLQEEKNELSTKLAVVEAEKLLFKSREQQLLDRLDKLENSLFNRI